MVVKVDKHGNRYHEPPYAQAEEDEFYRRVGGGRLLWPVQVVTVKGRSSRRRQNRTALKSLLEPVDPAPLSADNPARVLDVLAGRPPLR